MKIDSLKFPERLRRARLWSGLTQAAAAKAAGLESRQAWQVYEAGHVVPKIDLCERFAGVFKVDPGWLAGWK